MSLTQILKATFDQHIARNVIDRIREVAREVTYPAGTVLCQEGRLEKIFYIIVEGIVSISKKSEDGHDKFLGRLGRNEYFGEMGLIDDTPRFATCMAMNEVTVIEITDQMFEKIISDSPTVAFHIARHILKSMRQLDNLAIKDLREKNRALEKAYTDLKAAQGQIIEKERLEHEVKLAAAVQNSLLPEQFPEYPGYDLAAYLKPAKMIGGDFYDVIEIDDSHIGLLIADVADKGIHAAMFMAVTRTLFYTMGRCNLSPAEVSKAVHQGMIEIAPKTNAFVTAFYGVLHRPSGRFVYVRAGHEKPLLYRPGKPVSSLYGDGRFLGMMDGLELKEYEIKLKSGDRLVLFSDGVTDATNIDNCPYGYERFETCLQSGGARSAVDIVRTIVDDVASFCGDAPQFDDLSLLVLEVA